jgi:hypothetical protein
MGLFGLPYAIAGILGGLLPLLTVVLIVFFVMQRKGQEKDMPPLDLVDGKKLDVMVSHQVDAALKPLLKSEGYSDEQIVAILTPSSLGGPKFRR